MAEVVDRSTERHRRRRNVVVGTMVAGLALGACQSNLIPDTENTSATTAATVTSTSVRIPDLPTKLPSVDLPTLPDINVSNLPGLAGCAPYLDTAKFQNLEYEVCAAYIGNAASVALQGLYKFGNSRVSYLANGAKSHFETRYWGEPRQAAETEVNGWPKTLDLTGNKVENNIDLMALTSQYKQNRAFISTRESWRVSASNGTVLHDEPLHEKHNTLCRVRLPGHVLHEWVVVKSSDQEPQLVDCAEFAETNDLEQ